MNQKLQGSVPWRPDDVPCALRIGTGRWRADADAFPLCQRGGQFEGAGWLTPMLVALVPECFPRGDQLLTDWCSPLGVWW